MKINILKLLYYFTFILTFFTMFVIYLVPGTNIVISVGLPFVILLYIISFLGNPKKFRIYLKKLLNLEIIRYWGAFMIFVLITSIVHMALGYYSASPLFYFSQFRTFYVSTILIFLFPLLGLYIKINLKTLIKLFYTISFTIFVLGIIQYIAFILNINAILNVFDFFTNHRTMLYTNPATCYIEQRIFSIFEEPSALGMYIFIVMPFIFYYSRNKFRLYKNRVYEILINNFIEITMLIALILTKSPIYVSICMFEYFILSITYYRKYIKMHMIVIAPIALLSITAVVLLLVNYPEIIEESFLNRIAVSFENLRNFDSLIKNEPSLATRLISYAEQLIIFSKNIFMGVGLGNMASYAYKIFPVPPITQTPETFINFYKYTNIIALNRSAIYTTLAETGLIGFSLYFLFIIKNIKMLEKIKLNFVKEEYYFCLALQKSLLSIIIISFYNIHLTNVIVWLIFGLSLAILYTNKYLIGSEQI